MIMLSEKKNLPFEERNHADFEIVTTRIVAALEQIEKSAAIPATSEKLAELSACSRKTLYNRSWPLEKLSLIKSARKLEKQKKTAEAIELKGSVAQKSREDLLVEEVNNLRGENGKLFERVQVLEEQLNGAQRVAKALQQDMELLKTKSASSKSEQSLNQEAGKSNVLSFDLHAKNS